MPEHGGNLAAAVRRWGIPREAWLDLSTGINPCPWPLPPLPQEAVHRLPDEDDDLAEAACRCYGARHALPVPGSQAAIAWLPRLRRPGRIGVISPTYTEHAHHWRLAGHTVVALSSDAVEAALSELDVLVLVRPNNPDGRVIPRESVLDWWQRLREREGWLIVDEAFVDATPEDSLAAFAHEPGLIVLRSLGKFFGLPGLRLGFVLATTSLLARLADNMGPWAVSAPARYWGSRALRDVDWQRRMRERLARMQPRLDQLLQKAGLPVCGGTLLFRQVAHADAEDICETLGALGILIRYFPANRFSGPALRFGLPGDEAQWSRLEHALAIMKQG